MANMFGGGALLQISPVPAGKIRGRGSRPDSSAIYNGGGVGRHLLRTYSTRMGMSQEARSFSAPQMRLTRVQGRSGAWALPGGCALAAFSNARRTDAAEHD